LVRVKEKGDEKMADKKSDGGGGGIGAIIKHPFVLYGSLMLLAIFALSNADQLGTAFHRFGCGFNVDWSCKNLAEVQARSYRANPISPEGRQRTFGLSTTSPDIGPRIDMRGARQCMPCAAGFFRSPRPGKPCWCDPDNVGAQQAEAGGGQQCRPCRQGYWHNPKPGKPCWCSPS
jgi:hypothetical protein